MAPAVLELFMKGVEAMQRGDLDALLNLAAKDIVLVALRSPVEGEFRGHEGLRRFVEDNAESFEVWCPEYTEVRDLGGGQVLAIGSLHIRGRGGGVETDVPTAGIATFVGGKMTRWEDFGDRRTALEAAGIAVS